MMKKLNTHIRWPFVILVALVVIQFLALAFFVYRFPPFGGFDAKIVKPVADFKYKSSLTCHILYSTHTKGGGISLPWHEVSDFTLSALDSDQPKLETSYYSQHVALRKEFESDDYITLENREQRWDTETVGVFKKTGTFVRVMTGLQAGTERFFHYSIAQKGFCE